MTFNQQAIWMKYVALGFDEPTAMQLAQADPEWEDSESDKDEHNGDYYSQ